MYARVQTDIIRAQSDLRLEIQALRYEHNYAIQMLSDKVDRMKKRKRQEQVEDPDQSD